MKSGLTVFILGTLIVLAGCSKTKETLGLNRSVPDEFQVVKHAPLVMPPDYALRPPQPGAPRPQEQTPEEQARNALFGNSGGAVMEGASSSDVALLQQAGAVVTTPNIRAIVDKESAELVDENEPVAKKILNIGRDTPPPSTVVDPKAEAERIQQNKAEGKVATDGDSIFIE